MKKIFLLAVALLALSGCGGGDKEKADGADSVQALDANAPQPSVSDLTQRDTLKIDGQTYYVSVERKTDKTLPTVTDELGTVFYDNRVNVSVRRGDEQIFTRSFTKSDFAESLSENDKKSGVLQGMLFDKGKSSAQRLSFGAQVGEPGLEEAASTFVVSVVPGSSDAEIQRVQNAITTRDDMLGEEGD